MRDRIRLVEPHVLAITAGLCLALNVVTAALYADAVRPPQPPRPPDVAQGSDGETVPPDAPEPGKKKPDVPTTPEPVKPPPIIRNPPLPKPVNPLRPRVAPFAGKRPGTLLVLVIPTVGEWREGVEAAEAHAGLKDRLVSGRVFVTTRTGTADRTAAGADHYERTDVAALTAAATDADVLAGQTADPAAVAVVLVWDSDFDPGFAEPPLHPPPGRVPRVVWLGGDRSTALEKWTANYDAALGVSRPWVARMSGLASWANGLNSNLANFRWGTSSPPRNSQPR